MNCQLKKHFLFQWLPVLPLGHIKEIIGNNVPVFRAMPNTAIAIQESMTCLSASSANADQVHYIEDLFNQLEKPLDR